MQGDVFYFSIQCQYLSSSVLFCSKQDLSMFHPLIQAMCIFPSPYFYVIAPSHKLDSPDCLATSAFSSDAIYSNLQIMFFVPVCGKSWSASQHYLQLWASTWRLQEMIKSTDTLCWKLLLSAALIYCSMSEIIRNKLRFQGSVVDAGVHGGLF